MGTAGERTNASRGTGRKIVGLDPLRIPPLTGQQAREGCLRHPLKGGESLCYGWGEGHAARFESTAKAGSAPRG